MYISNNITCNAVLQGNVYQTLLTHEMSMRAEHDFPDISFGQRFAVFEPLDHRPDKLECNLVFAVIGSI